MAEEMITGNERELLITAIASGLSMDTRSEAAAHG